MIYGILNYGEKCRYMRVYRDMSESDAVLLDCNAWKVCDKLIFKLDDDASLFNSRFCKIVSEKKLQKFLDKLNI